MSSKRQARRKFFSTKAFGLHRILGRTAADRLPTRCANCNRIIDWAHDWKHMETGSIWCGADGARRAVPR